jgi:hypothetical protein
MTNTKITKKDRFATLIALFNGDIILKDIADADDYVAFFEKEVAALDKKAAKAKETAAKKKAEGDELTDRIADVLTDDFATISDIVKALGDEDVSNQKASYRLGKLVDAGKAVKGELNIGGEGKARKVVAYKLAD